ncbi:MAG: metal ABC transporter substrate-binding protein [Synechocystis sp.]|nr:metal ABC transporter substrate-binding protein [Synechocystis sp.]
MLSGLRFPVVMLGLGLAVVAGLTGCGNYGESNRPADPNQSLEADNPAVNGNRKKVLTTFTVLADMARNVAGDKLEVESITRVGSEIHGYEPTPSDIKKAQTADLILVNGLDLERWVEPFLGNVKDVPAVTLTDGITPIPIAEGPYANLPNPHAWMSPKMAKVYVDNIRQAFVELDPDNAETYNANAEAYKKQLTAIADQLETAIAQVPESQRVLVTCEGAFSYLAKDYGLQEVYLWPINADQQSTPQQVKAVIDQVKARNVPTVFCESTVNPEGQKVVAQATGAKYGGNLYVDSLSQADGPVPTYLDLLTYDIEAIANGLQSRSP